jgi:hypothetical protein
VAQGADRAARGARRCRFTGRAPASPTFTRGCREAGCARSFALEPSSARLLDGRGGSVTVRPARREREDLIFRRIRRDSVASRQWRDEAFGDASFAGIGLGRKSSIFPKGERAAPASVPQPYRREQMMKAWGLDARDFGRLRGDSVPRQDECCAFESPDGLRLCRPSSHGVWWRGVARAAAQSFRRAAALLARIANFVAECTGLAQILH